MSNDVGGDLDSNRPYWMFTDTEFEWNVLF